MTPVQALRWSEWLDMPDRSDVLASDVAHTWLLSDADLVRSTATWLRTDPDGAWVMGLTSDEDVRVVTALLDLVAAELPHVDPAVARTVVAWCRFALGEPTD